MPNLTEIPGLEGFIESHGLPDYEENNIMLAVQRSWCRSAALQDACISCQHCGVIFEREIPKLALTYQKSKGRPSGYIAAALKGHLTELCASPPAQEEQPCKSPTTSETSLLGLLRR